MIGGAADAVQLVTSCVVCTRLEESGDADQDGPRLRHPDRRQRAGFRRIHESPLPRRAACRAWRHVCHRNADFQHDGRDVHHANDSSIPQDSRAAGLEHFDAWAATFGEVIDTMEISPDGASLRPRSRFARFTNLPELQQMFRAFSDVQTAEMLNLPRPRLEDGKPIVVACPMSEEQHALQQELVERYERLRSQKVDPRVDNALNITTDGRKLATDARMLSPTAPDFPESKVNRLVENVACHLEPHRRDTRHADDIRRHGREPDALGIFALRRHHQETRRPRHPARADRRHRRRRIRRQETGPLREGAARFGARADRQHPENGHRHQRPETPGRPASPRRSLEAGRGRTTRRPHPPPGQRERGSGDLSLRHEGSFDSYMWQALETKARFIGQVITGDNAARRAEDIGGQELSYAEVKAIASGNPAVLTLAEADAELQRLTLLKKNHLDEQYVARRSVRDLPGTIASLSERLPNLTADQATATAHAADPIIIGKRRVAREDVAAALAAQLDALPTNIREKTRVPLGTYRGLRFGMVLNPQWSPEVYLEGATTRLDTLSRDHHGPRAVLNALDRLANAYGSECVRVQQELVHRRIPAARLPGPPGQAVPARCLPVRTDRLA